MLSTTRFNPFSCGIGADRTNVAEGHQRVGGSLDINHARAAANRTFHVFYFGGIHIGDFDPIAGKNLVEQPWYTAIKVVTGDNVVSRPEHGAQGIDGGHATGENSRGDSAFERRQIFFEASTRRIRYAGVLVAFVLTQLLLEVGGSGIDGDGNGAGFSIGLLTSVNGASGETGEFGFGHRKLNLARSIQPSALSIQPCA